MTSTQEADEIKARVEKDIELAFSLMEKFGIEPKDDYAFVRLSIDLARKLYPNGLRNVGRPRTRSITRITKQLGFRKRGRPVTKQKFRSTLLKAVRAVKAQHRMKGRGSDKRALEILIEEIARDQQRSTLRARAEYLTAWQKDLSRARKT